MSSVRYTTESGELVARDCRSGELLHKYSFEVPIRQFIPKVEFGGCVVLLDARVSDKPTFENLFMIRADGTNIWSAKLPESHDAFVNVVDQGATIVAHTWRGHLLEIDVATGRTMSDHFTK